MKISLKVAKPRSTRGIPKIRINKGLAGLAPKKKW